MYNLTLQEEVDEEREGGGGGGEGLTGITGITGYIQKQDDRQTCQPPRSVNPFFQTHNLTLQAKDDGGLTGITGRCHSISKPVNPHGQSVYLCSRRTT